MTSLQNSTVPRHIAIIMDGNGRWAKSRFLPRVAGHKVGVDVVRQIVKSCVKHKIEVLSLFAFSSENWRRPPQEVSYLMKLFIKSLDKESKKLHKQNIQLRVIGDRSHFDEKLQRTMTNVETLTQHNTGLKLIIAANYGGQWDICKAMLEIATQIQQQNLQLSDISPELIHAKLTTADLPDPDLLIRTSGEQRISNFMLWQLAYSEIYFTDTLWPDFNEEEFEKALTFYSNRERRFGFISEQIKDKTNA